MSAAASGLGRFSAMQYRPASSPLHALDARTKILAGAIAIGAVLAAPHPLGYVAIVALLAAASALGRIGPGLLWRVFGPVIILFVVGSILVAFLVPGPPAFTVGPFHVSTTARDLIIRGVVQALVIFYTSALVTITTAPSALGNGLLWYMRPLRRIGVPVDDIAVMVGLGLAFLPLIQQELQRIILAQRVRGADFRRGSMEQRALNMLALLPTLLTGNLRRAEELAVAMEARGYVPGLPRTVLNGGHVGAADLAAIMLAVAAAVVAIKL